MHFFLSRMHFYEEELMVQQKNGKDEMRSSLLEEIKLILLKAYAYILPIIAVNPNRPTLQELRTSRLIIYYTLPRIYIHVLSAIKEHGRLKNGSPGKK